MLLEDTIAAIATPLGEGGLAVVRLSGSQAVKIADACFRPAAADGPPLAQAPTHTIHYGHLTTRAGDVIDEVLVSVMRQPRTFTREDVVEITCHGGLLPSKAVLDALLGAGARLAEPGEFTRRAFLNGRIDLAQAEAVADLIHSRTELAMRAANEQLAGKLSRRIAQLRDELLQILAHVEAHIDFPDEDIAPNTRDQLIGRVDQGITLMDELLRTANEGQILRRGIRAAIVGRPNVGKSSLLNQLLGHDRAIVSPVPGTTRDTVEETANIRGIPIVFIDTAGLRESADEVEQEGIRRSRKSLEKAELVLHVVDASCPITDSDRVYLQEFKGKKWLLVRNKIDLGKVFQPDSDTPVVDVCCVSGQGIDQLKTRIEQTVWAGQVRADMLEVAINSRHQDALNRGRDAAVRARDALRQDHTLELIAMDLRIAVNAIGEIVGQTTTEDLLDVIFSQFCIGK